MLTSGEPLVDAAAMLLDELESQSQMHKLGVLKSTLEGKPVSKESESVMPRKKEKTSDLTSQVKLKWIARRYKLFLQADGMGKKLNALRTELASLQRKTKHITDEASAHGPTEDVTKAVRDKLSQAAQERASLRSHQIYLHW